MTEPRYLFISAFSSLYLLHYSCLSISQYGIRASSILAAAFWWLLGLILLAVFLFDCFLAALFHHHGCVDVVLGIFGGSLLLHLCLVAGVYCLYSGIRISLFHLS